MTVRGEITSCLAVVGLRQGDDRALDAMALVGMPSDTSEFSEPGSPTWMYLTARDAGTDVLFDDRILSSVAIRTQPSAKYGVYPRPNALIDGLAGTADRDELREKLGEPEWSSAVAERFPMDGRYLDVEYDREDRAKRFTAMLTMP